MSSVVLPSPPPFASSSSSLVTFVIITSESDNEAQLSLTPVKQSSTLIVSYLWFGGHKVVAPLVEVITGSVTSLTITVCV